MSNLSKSSKIGGILSNLLKIITRDLNTDSPADIVNKVAKYVSKKQIEAKSNPNIIIPNKHNLINYFTKSDELTMKKFIECMSILRLTHFRITITIFRENGVESDHSLDVHITDVALSDDDVEDINNGKKGEDLNE